ncbi:MAG: restriction endonuclease [Terracidiphilus sp.]
MVSSRQMSLASPNSNLDRETRFGSCRETVVISVSEGIIKRLKKEPKDVYKHTPRQYAELIADLLREMGHDVTLTQAARDGGKDILASMKTEVGEFLCLVARPCFARCAL